MSNVTVQIADPNALRTTGADANVRELGLGYASLAYDTTHEQRSVTAIDSE